jgi:23S rRNA (cytosine1962-C5)-methyltransferase
MSMDEPESARRQCEHAISLRSTLAESVDTDAYRLIHSTADGFAGLTVDVLAGILLVEQHRPESDPSLLINALVSIYGPETPVFFKARWSRNSHERSGRQVAGPSHGGLVTVSENGLRFHLHLLDEEHIGLFLDSRPTRSWVAAESQNKRMLNLFAYTGGFGMAAARGGARSTVNIDNKASAMRHARRNYETSALPYDSRTFFQCDVLYYLKRAATTAGRFDLIVLDPPPRFKRHHGRDFEMDRDYGHLLGACLPIAASTATIIAGLNSCRVSDTQFMEMIAAEMAAEKDLQWRVLRMLGPGDDFPPTTDRPVARFAAIEIVNTRSG